MATRVDVQHWISEYEAAWRAAGTDLVESLFAQGARYMQSPYAEPLVGLTAISKMWEAEREGPDEVFTLETEVVAVEHDTAVVRAKVSYGNPVQQEYTDLWVLHLDDDGRCTSFEEWPFWPNKPWSERD
jgi:ketosteroid isomerase-like protein